MHRSISPFQEEAMNGQLEVTPVEREQSQAHMSRTLFTSGTEELLSPSPMQHSALVVIPKAPYWVK